MIQSAWIEVIEEDNFFNKYAYNPLIQQPTNDDSDSDNGGGAGISKSELEKMARIELQIDQGKITDQKQMLNALLETDEREEASDNHASLQRKKNEKIKKLIEDDLDAFNNREIAVYKKKVLPPPFCIHLPPPPPPLLQDWLNDTSITPNNKKEVQAKKTAEEDTSSNKAPSLFKKRVNNNKNVQKIQLPD